MILFKYRFHYILILTITILIFDFSKTQANIVRKVERDGTITFHNNTPPPRASQSPRRAVLSLSSRFDELIERISREEGVDSKLIKSIIKVESDFQPDAVSVAGAMGLMQLMKATADMYNVSDPFDPEENVRAGVRHFKYLLGELNNDIPLALAAYHAGLAAVRRNHRIPRIKSTMDYVNRVMTIYSGNPVVVNPSQPRSKPIRRQVDRDGDLIFTNH